MNAVRGVPMHCLFLLRPVLIVMAIALTQIMDILGTWISCPFAQAQAAEKLLMYVLASCGRAAWESSGGKRGSKEGMGERSRKKGGGKGGGGAKADSRLSIYIRYGNLVMSFGRSRQKIFCSAGPCLLRRCHPVFSSTEHHSTEGLLDCSLLFIGSGLDGC